MSSNLLLWMTAVVVLGLLSFCAQESLASQPADLKIVTLGTALYTGVAVDPTSDSLFVCDKVGNRVLRFDNRQSLTSASTPALAIGQSTLSSVLPNNGGSVGSVGLYSPYAATVDKSGALWVSDTANRRVVCYKQASTLSSGATAASIVLGQKSFTTNALNITATGMSSPYGLRASDTDLWVTDNAASRVLRFGNILSITSSQAADSVVGQPDFTSQGSIPVSATNLYGVTDAQPTSSGLLVASSLGNRVTFYPSSVMNNNGPAATFAYGQLDLTSSSPGTDAVGFNTPTGLAVGYDGTLFVSEKTNNRIKIYPPVPPIANGISAEDVLGQPDLNSVGFGAGLSNLRAPNLIAYDAAYNALWVADTGNLRILRYSNILPKVNNQTQLETQVTFVGRTPNVILSPTNSGNGTNLLIAPSSIEELDSGGNVVATYAWPTYGYTFSSSVDANQTQTFHFVTPVAGSTVTVDYSLYAVTVPLSSAGVSFAVGPGSLKLSLNIDNWNFNSSSNTLRIHFALKVQPAVTAILSNNTNNITSFTVESSTSVTTVRLLPFGLVDNSTVAPVQFDLTTSATTSTNSTLDLVLGVPHFSQSFSYDPDFSIKLVQASTTTGNTNASPGARLRNWLSLLW